MESFNESTADPNMNGPKYIDTIIEQVNGADPTSSWREFAEEYIFSEQDIKNGSFRRLTPGLIDVSIGLGTLPTLSILFSIYLLSFAAQLR